MMYFVTEVEFDDESHDYKVFGKYTDACSRFRTAIHYATNGKTVRKKHNRQEHIRGSCLWRVDTESVKQAAQLAKLGDANLLDQWRLKEGPFSLDEFLD